MTSIEYWNHLISDFRDILKEGRNASTDKKAWQQTIDALDRIVDEIKSESFIPKELIPKILVLFHKVFTFGIGTVDFWAFKHMTLFAMCHIYNQYENDPDALLDLIKRNNVDDDIHLNSGSFLIDCLIASIHDVKREVRDAASQNFGALVSILGNDLIDLILPNLLELMKDASKETFEGLMMTFGYLASKCKDISESNWNNLTQLLIVESENTTFESYSRYVRVNALKGLNRVVQSATIASFTTHNNVELILKAIRATLGDEDIDVRRASGNLFASYYTFKSKNHDFPATLLKECLTYFKELESNNGIRWEVRHGIACSIESIANSNYLVEYIDKKSSEEWLTFLGILIQKDDSDKSSFSSNSTAGFAQVQLINSLRIKLNTEDIADLFKRYLIPQLEFMLQSPHPQLLDASSRIINNLCNTSIEFIFLYMDKLLSLVFKNRFHAAYPIRSSANITWNSSHALAFKQFKTEDELISYLTPHITEHLLNAANHNNYEVRETVFQALSRVLKVTSSNFPSKHLDKINSTILFGINDKIGGTNSDYPRSAAIRALGSFMFYCSRFNIDISEFVSDIEQILEELLQHPEETLLIKATLYTVEVIGANFRELFKKSLPKFAFQTYKFSHMIFEDDIRFAAIPTYTSCFSPKKNECLQEQSFFLNFIDTLENELNDEDKDEAEKDAIARVLRDISSIDFSSLNIPNSYNQKLLNLFSEELLKPENIESVVFSSGLLLFLLSISKNTDFLKSLELYSKEAISIASILLNILKGIDPSEELDEDLEELDFEILDLNNLVELNKVEVCISILLNLLSYQFKSNELLVQTFKLIVKKYQACNPIKNLFSDKSLSDKLVSFGLESISTSNDEIGAFSNIDEVIEFIENFEIDNLEEEWDVLDDELSDKRAYLAPIDSSRLFFGNLITGEFKKQHDIYNRIQDYLQNLSVNDQISFFTQCSEKISNNEDGLQNLATVLYFITSQDSNKFKLAIEKSDIQSSVNSTVLESEIPHLWLLYGELISITKTISENIFKKISSSDSRVEFLNKFGEGIIPYIGITLCKHAIYFKNNNDNENLNACLQALSDILFDMNCVEKKDLLRFGFESITRAIGAQILPDPTPASDKSNAKFI